MLNLFTIVYYTLTSFTPTRLSICAVGAYDDRYLTATNTRVGCCPHTIFEAALCALYIHTCIYINMPRIIECVRTHIYAHAKQLTRLLSHAFHCPYFSARFANVMLTQHFLIKRKTCIFSSVKMV